MQPQLPVIQFDMNDFMAHQQQMEQANERQHQHMHHVNQHVQPMQQHQQGREAYQIEEPVVGSPLGIGLSKLSLNPLGLGLHPLGLGFHNFNAGHFGGLHFANSLLGSGNPMEAESNDPQLERRHHHHLDNELGAPQNQQFGADMPQSHLEPQLAAPQQPQGFWPWHHFANPDSELGAALPQQFEAQQQFDTPPQNFQSCSCPPQNQNLQVGTPQMGQFEMQPMGHPMPQQMQFQPMHQQPMPMEDEARTWGKGHQADYGYG